MYPNEISLLQEMVDKGQFKKAKDFAKLAVSSKLKICNNAEFWFVYGVAVRLTDHDNDLLASINQNMGLCKNFNELMAGDWLRDDILYAIRRNELTELDVLLPVLKSLHQNDANRLAAIKMVEGRIAYAKKDYPTALKYYLDADKAWRDLKTSANNQWKANNLFAMYKVMVALKNGNRYPTAIEIISKDKSRFRRVRTKFINQTGRLGNAIDDILMRIRFA